MNVRDTSGAGTRLITFVVALRVPVQSCRNKKVLYSYEERTLVKLVFIKFYS
jgi:hypothetical protein